MLRASHPQCFKAVSALFDRQLRRCASPLERLNLLYAAHKVLISAKRALKNKSRYREQGPGANPNQQHGGRGSLPQAAVGRAGGLLPVPWFSLPGPRGLLPIVYPDG